MTADDRVTATMLAVLERRAAEASKPSKQKGGKRGH